MITKISEEMKKTSILSWLIRLANTSGLFVIVFYLGSWTKDAETRMFDSAKQKNNTIEHLEDCDELSETVSNSFVLLDLKYATKSELKASVETIDAKIDGIDKKIDIIIKYSK